MQEPEPQIRESQRSRKPRQTSENVSKLPQNKFIRPNVDAESLQLPLVRFPGLKRVDTRVGKPCAGWTAFCKEIAPTPHQCIAQKDRVPYFIAGTLKEAEQSTNGCANSG